MSTKNRTAEEQLTNNYWEYIFGITKAGFFVTLLNPFEGAVERKQIFAELPDDISKFNDLRNDIIINLKDIVNDKELSAKKFEECMEARKKIAAFSESMLPYVSVCSIPLEKLEEEDLTRGLDGGELESKEPDYVSIYDKCMKLLENIPNTQWESYIKCRLFGILPFGMTKAKFYDMLGQAADTLTAGKNIAYVDKFYRLQTINYNPKGYEGFGKNFASILKDVERISALNPADLTDDGLMEAKDSMVETVQFFKSIIENIDELYKDLGLFALIFCQGYDFETLTGDDPIVRDEVYYVQEIVKKGGFDENDILEADKADRIKEEIIDNFSAMIDYARNTRQKIMELHRSFTGTYKEGLSRVMDFASFAENLYYGNAEDDFLAVKENAGELADLDYLEDSKENFMNELKAFADNLSPADRKTMYRKLISTLYIPMEKVEFCDYFVNELKGMDEGKRNIVLLKFDNILDNEMANNDSCSCGHHHHDEDHECCCGHHHDEDHECCGKHHHDEDHECECGHHHDDVETF